MAKEILVNVNTRETRVALVDSGKLVELHIERAGKVVGSIYKCKVANVLPGMDAAFVDIGLERNAFLYAGDVLPEAGEDLPQTKQPAHVGIKDLLKVSQELMVQVVKAPRGTKGARVSTRISLPGRYLVLMPDADNIGISRKIVDRQERDRLKKLVDNVKPKGFGVIARTEAEGVNERELHHDMSVLLRLWTQIQDKSKITNAPGLVHQDLSLIYRTVRDVFGSDVHKMFIDSPSDYEKALDLIRLLSPRQKSRLVLYDGSEPMFEHFAIENEIDRLLRRKVWLRSGGHITIDETEALTTIDVNTGKFIGSTSLSDTILKTNVEATAEIARQLRLRDIGGIIIIDFIDMSSSKDKNHVLSGLEKALKKDRMRTKISHISPLGLVEMTRKRTGETINQVLNQACPYCQGHGHVLSAESVSILAERELRQKAGEMDDEAFIITAHPDVAEFLVGPGGENADALESKLRRAVYIRSSSEMHVEKYEICPGDLQELERQMMPFRKGQVVECEVVRNAFVSLPRSSAWAEGGYLLDLANGGKYVGQSVRARLTRISRSLAQGEVVGTVKKHEEAPGAAAKPHVPVVTIKKHEEALPSFKTHDEERPAESGRPRRRRRPRSGSRPAGPAAPSQPPADSHSGE